ncbi:MAG: ATP-binding cassette domain-containing protein [Candidatus Altiarchaeales archaeon]|nr:ATP-binding cassette domain-containing protein [Candidatus Altiarchaeales archaeon]
MALVELKDVSVSYGQTPALEVVNLRVEEKDFLGLIGPNGGGKTTILKAILGLVKPSSGEVLVFGKTPAEGRKHLGYVPQHSLFDPQFPINVWDVVLTGRLGEKGITGRYGEKDKKVAIESLQKVDMLDQKDRHISTLSGGQRQRVFIARALASQPKILLLDEPTASVDVHMESQFYELLKKLNGEMAIVLATHDMGVVSSYVKNLACVNRTVSYHPGGELKEGMLEDAYQCPVEMIAHGLPHRVLGEHKK